MMNNNNNNNPAALQLIPAGNGGGNGVQNQQLALAANQQLANNGGGAIVDLRGTIAAVLREYLPEAEDEDAIAEHVLLLIRNARTFFNGILLRRLRLAESEGSNPSSLPLVVFEEEVRNDRAGTAEQREEQIALMRNIVPPNTNHSIGMEDYMEWYVRYFNPYHLSEAAVVELVHHYENAQQQQQLVNAQQQQQQQAFAMQMQMHLQQQQQLIEGNRNLVGKIQGHGEVIAQQGERDAAAIDKLASTCQDVRAIVVALVVSMFVIVFWIDLVQHYQEEGSGDL